MTNVKNLIFLYEFVESLNPYKKLFPLKLIFVEKVIETNILYESFLEFYSAHFGINPKKLSYRMLVPMNFQKKIIQEKTYF